MQRAIQLSEDFLAELLLGIPDEQETVDQMQMGNATEEGESDVNSDVLKVGQQNLELLEALKH